MTVAAARSHGLSEQEAGRRLAERAPSPQASSRSYGSIVRANVFTVFNLILLVFGVLTLAFGDWQDALFLGILVANAAIGILQEIRAKRALDRLAALVAPTARVLRDGRSRRVPVEEVVEGDLVQLAAGDQVVADGHLERGEGLLVDESILTGESAAVPRARGEEVRSGSFAVEGTGAYVVTAVGPDSYAAKVAGEARKFRHPRSPLERALDRLLFVLVAVVVPLGVILGYALWRRNTPFSDAVTTSVAAVVTLIPEGLILLTSLTYAVAAARMARRGVLAQQLNAIESIASIDVVCLDKTGTLTEPGLRLAELVPAAGVAEEELAVALGRYAASATSRNSTLAALADGLVAEPEPVQDEVPFVSRRRWSSLRLAGRSYVLGAPELFELDGLGHTALEHASAGRRVLAFGTSDDALTVHDEEPPRLDPLGLAVLAEKLRPDARETVAFFTAQDVTLKVISGDRPETVAAIAADAGVPNAWPPLDGGSLPADQGELRRLLQDVSVIGRIAPDDKRRVVEALASGGLAVAMVGDGVNDVPALKASRLALAQGSGTEMARAVADLVLVRGDFASVPALVAEGRKVLRNLQRVAKLFVAKSAFAVFLVLSVGLTPTAYPLLPRHLTLAAAVTIGIPAFFLALGPSTGPYRVKGFLREVARFAFPAGTAAGLGVLASYLFALNVARIPLVEARTIATSVVVIVGLYLILALEWSGPRRGAAVATLCGVLLFLYVLVLVTPGGQAFFDLDLPGPGGWFIILFGAAVSIAGLWLTDDRFIPGRGAALAET